MSNDSRSTYTLLHDPLAYDPLKDGPPYLPGLIGGKVAGMKGRARAWVRCSAVEMGADISQALQHCVADYGGAPMAELAVLLSCLRAETLIHQAHHWQTQGHSYYGDHLLFERVYGEVHGLIDGLAERAVGKGDAILVQPLLQMSHMVVFSKLFYADAPVRPTSQEMPLLSFRAVMKSSVLLQLVYSTLEGKGQLSNGLDNLLQGIADKQESLIYLLNQRTKDN
jgi:DNA-binding ferritin-like protein